MGSVLHLKKIGFKHAVHMHMFTVNHLFYLQSGSVTLNLLKNIVTDRNTYIVLYYQMDVRIKSISISY